MRTILYIFCFLSFSTQAQTSWFVSGGRSAAMGKTSAATVDYWSVSNNQAAMAFAKNASAGFYYENRFLLKEMGCSSLAFIFPTHQGSFGATFAYSGDANFNHLQTGLAYAKSFGKRFSAGVKFDYLQTKLAENYGTHSNITFEAGILAKITSNLRFGAHAFNPIRVKMADYNNERIPTVVNLGVSYTFSDVLVFNVEVVKDTEKETDFRFGAEYQFVKYAYIRAGLTTEASAYSFGIGFLLNQFSLDISSSVDQVLGVSPQLSFQYDFGNFKK